MGDLLYYDFSSVFLVDVLVGLSQDRIEGFFGGLDRVSQDYNKCRENLNALESSIIGVVCLYK